MTTLNLKKPFTSLKGEAIETAIMSEYVADAIAKSNNTNEAIKWYDWAIKLHNDGEIQVDDADLDKIKSFVKNKDFFNVLTSACILKEIEKSKK